MRGTSTAVGADSIARALVITKQATALERGGIVTRDSREDGGDETSQK